MIYLLPFIAAAVGWFTNFIAVKMLFRPQRPINFFFFKLQGVFPKNQKLVAERIGKMIAEELLSSDDIKDKMSTQDNIEFIKTVFETKIEDYLNNTFPQNYPITSVFFGQKRKTKIKEDLVLQVEKAAPDVIDQYIRNLEMSFNVEEIVQDRVEKLSPARLEKLIMGILDKEFAFIEWVGALIGFLIGLIQVALVSL
jgi:uncharacterized membrane protein YheB (UPF0754 family)